VVHEVPTEEYVPQAVTTEDLEDSDYLDNSVIDNEFDDDQYF